MALTATDRNDLTRLSLVASDASYAGRGLSVGAPLAPFPDSQGQEVPCPYADEITASGYVVADSFQDDATGFKYVAFVNSVTNDVVVAFAGSDGVDAKDWWGNLYHYGWNQWDANRDRIFGFLANLRNADESSFTGRIHFTGQSLGGALAQYAAFEFVRDNQTFNKQNLTLTTFNALGAVAALNENLGTGFNHDLLMGMGSIAHYRTPNDFVSRLGEGHLGGDAVYELPFRPGGTNPVTNRPFEFDLIPTHRIESGFYANLREADGWFSNARRTLPEAGYLLIPNLQRVASFFGNPFKNEAVSSPEALIRLSSGVMYAAIFAPNAETNRLVWSIALARFNAGQMSKEQAEGVLGVDWGRTATLWGIAITVANPLALVSTWVGSVILGRLASGFGLATGDAVRTVQEEFGPAETVKEPAEVPLPQSEARFNVLLARLEAEPGSAIGSVDVEGLAERLASGQGWEQASLEYVQQTTGKSATELVALDARFGALMYDAALAATGDNGSYAQQMFEVLRSHFEEAGRKIANSNGDLTLKYANVDSGLFGTTTDFLAFEAISNALHQAKNDPKNAQIAGLLEQELQTVEAAGQIVVFSEERSQNPFDNPVFDPGAAALPQGEVREGGIKRFTLSLPYEARGDGQRIAIAMGGTTASNVKLLANGEEVLAQNGIYTVMVEEGDRELELGVWGQIDVVENGGLSLSATLVDASGQATHLTHLEANVSLVARNERVFDGAPDLAGDSSQFALIQGGVTGQRGLYIDFQGGDDIIWADAAEDRLMGGAGNDRLYGSFRTYSNAHDRDWLSGGSGDDWLLGHEGDDILEGDSGSDLLLGDLGDDFLFANNKSDYSTIFTTGGGDGEGDLLQGGAGKDLVVGSAGADDLSGGNDADLILGGAGSDEIRGDTEFIPTHGFLIHGITFPPEQPLAAGADVIYGNAGSDAIFGEGANDLLYGGEGRDTLTGGDGDDELYGGTGDDFLNADNGNAGGGSQGNDFLDGGEGDDQLRGENGSDTLIGGRGNDELEGGEGGDTYAFSAGDGRDTIVEQGASGVDVLILEDHARPDITIARLVNGSIHLIGANGDTITIAGVSLGTFGIDRVQFADGTSLNGAELIAASFIDEGSIEGPGWERFSDADDTIVTADVPGVDESGFVLVDAGPGDDIVHGSAGAIVFGNDGSDTLIGGRILLGGQGSDHLSGASRLLGGAGDDELRDGEILMGGAGDDSLDGGAGADRYVFEAEEPGVDVVADTHGLLPEELADWYYPFIGIHDWRALLANPERDGSLPLEEAIAAGFLPPLPRLAANDYAALEPLYTAGNIELDTIELPEGLELEDILAEVSETENTLTLAWGEGQVIHVALADPDDPVGTGIEVFQIVGGATMTLGEMLAWADPPPLSPILGTGDDDFLFGTASSDRIRGLGGADDIAGAEGNDELGGDEGGDRLFGEAGNDKLIGGIGDDALVGGPGDDTLSGDFDRDFLEGGEGNDEYVFARGDGIDHIFDQGGVDSVRFLEGIAPGDVAVTSDPHGTLHLVVTESNDRLILSGWLGDEVVRVEKVVFADGTAWDVTNIQDRIAALSATGFGDVLTRTTSNDTVDGLGGNDEIYGHAGDDVLEGGAGDDYLEGDAGNDILRGGQGGDSAWDWQGNNLLDGGAGDDILVADGASSGPGGGSNLVVGGTGDDWIDSYASGNIVAFNAGDGHDTIYAVNALTLSLGNGIAPADLVLSQDGDDLLLTIGSVDSIRLTRQFEEDPRAWPQITLQMFGSVHLYDFSAVIAEFYEVLASDPLSTGFALGGVLQEHETSMSETDALGGALAHQYGTTGNLNSFSEAAIRQILANPNFGSAPQSIEVPIANQAPSVAVALLDQSVQEDSAFSFTIPGGTFSDPDAGDVLTYSASLANDDPLPSWLKFDSGSRTFSGAPGAADAGTLSVRVTATDLAGEIAIDDFEILVSGNAHGVRVTGTPDNDALTGTAHDDVLDGLGGRDRLAGLGGNDLLNGGRGIDRLFGGDGQDMLFGDRAKDTLYGGAGNDLLAGGRGNDCLHGGGGDDVYVYETHGGLDVIAETGGTDSLIFGEGITPGMARVQRRDNDLVVELSGQNGSLTVRGWFESGSNKVEAIRFSDGTTWGVKEIRDRARHNGNDRGDQIDDHGRHVRDRHDSPHDRSDTPQHDDGHSRRRAHQVADYLAALLAEKPRYDFEVLAQEVEQPERYGEALSTREIARRWQRVAWYGAGSPNEQDDHERNGAASSFNGNGPLGGSAFGNSFGYAGSIGARRGAANLRTLDGLEEGFERLSL